MTEMTQNFLSLLFDQGEEICISPNKYAYHSIPQDAVNDNIQLISPNQDYGPMTIKESDINLITINPIKGWRKDDSVQAFRSFLVEIDTGTLEEQKKYIDESGMPYSACVFSGNKSLHYAITLKEALPGIAEWRFYNQWLLNVLPKIDQQNKNPARHIRFPGNRRHNGKKLIQALVEQKGRVSQEDFFKWLFSHEDVKPIQRRERLNDVLTGIPDITKLPTDVVIKLEAGITENRNASWFYIACRFAEQGFTIDTALDYLGRYFQPDSDFKNREFEGCVISAYKRIQGDLYVKEN